jgi:hypothetical protein
MVGSQDPSAAWPGAHKTREGKCRATSVGMTVHSVGDKTGGLRSFASLRMTALLVVASWIEVESKPAPLTPKGAAPNYRKQPKIDPQKAGFG